MPAISARDIFTWLFLPDHKVVQAKHGLGLFSSKPPTFTS
jgi:hypothetical protein